jgi:hypothetical protein
MPVFRAFDDHVTAFLSNLSSELLSSSLSSREAKRYPDVAAFAFWCRKANLARLEKTYSADADTRLGRGVAFHIAPSNVPVNFAYTLVCGMLSGNANVVRLPAKDFPQTEIIRDAIDKTMLEHSEIAERLCLVRYAHDKSITDALSEICMSRVIWGGDETVSEIRKSPLPPRANEVTFPDRYSICVIDAGKYLADCDKEKTAEDFFNDTYLTDQNACTSPRIVFWYGENTDEAKDLFWAALSKLLINHYDIQPVQTVDKLTAFYEFAAEHDCGLRVTGNYKIVRVAVREAGAELSGSFGNSGYFYECDIRSLDGIVPLCGRKCQTLSYIGFDAEELRKFVLNKAVSGIDRIVPVGKTMDFALVWDGIDLIGTLSRKITAM